METPFSKKERYKVVNTETVYVREEINENMHKQERIEKTSTNLIKYNVTESMKINIVE